MPHLQDVTKRYKKELLRETNQPQRDTKDPKNDRKDTQQN